MSPLRLHFRRLIAYLNSTTVRSGAVRVSTSTSTNGKEDKITSNKIDAWWCMYEYVTHRLSPFLALLSNIERDGARCRYITSPRSDSTYPDRAHRSRLSQSRWGLGALTLLQKCYVVWLLSTRHSTHWGSDRPSPRHTCPPIGEKTGKEHVQGK